ncbi:MAG TPA: sigma-70 family RNA polymerase sigma factor [Candidatus Paceibacterota bacterium]|nr:sigma-70 family RNA polymerase sigma factor [Candidatus Pacearchaeota archaeon]HQG09482.1 sigma-70 family RNA polymerase sigma factor [Candidatus Pacearchaeota archaeon]HRR94921.1 sigma-70 family RNA polymerase sigma factor [Candidatus Paceibacterota bacterium]
MQHLTDEQLVIKYLQGEKQALEILVARYMKPVYSLAYSYVNNSADAEDITQEVFVKFWKNIHKFDQKRKFKPWIFEIAKNTAIDFTRKKKTIPFSHFNNEEGDNMLIETLRDKAPLPLDIYERKDTSNQLFSAIKKLSVKYQEVISLRIKEEMTFEEIANLLGESVNTIKSRYRRGIFGLQKLLPND